MLKFERQFLRTSLPGRQLSSSRWAYVSCNITFHRSSSLNSIQVGDCNIRRQISTGTASVQFTLPQWTMSMVLSERPMFKFPGRLQLPAETPHFIPAPQIILCTTGVADDRRHNGILVAALAVYQYPSPINIQVHVLQDQEPRQDQVWFEAGCVAGLHCPSGRCRWFC